MLDRILQFIAEYLTPKAVATLTSDNWTAGKADFVTGNIWRWGNTRTLYMQVKTNAAIADGEEATLGTLTGVTTSGMVNGVGVGIGVVTGLNNGIMRQQTPKALSAGTNIYIRFWWQV